MCPVAKTIPKKRTEQNEKKTIQIAVAKTTLKR